MTMYDRAGEPIDTATWTDHACDDDYCTIARDTIGDVLVSTVWLGLDYSGFDSGPPVIFETMVFPEGERRRYATETEAVAGHEAIVRQLTQS